MTSSERETGYRDAVANAPAPTPTGEILAPTDGDEAELNRLRARERSRSYGMGIGAAVLFKWVAPLLTGVPYLSGLIMLGAAALFLYAIASRFAPGGLGPVVVRLSPDREVTAGLRLGVAVVLRPGDPLKLDPLTVRLVARRSEGGRERVVYESGHVLAERQAVEAERAVRVETSFLIAEDAPPTSQDPRIRWRVEVAIGAPPIFRRSLPVRVRPTTRRRRPKTKSA